jgi:hypothetical protein
MAGMMFLSTVSAVRSSEEQAEHGDAQVSCVCRVHAVHCFPIRINFDHVDHVVTAPAFLHAVM